MMKTKRFHACFITCCGNLQHLANTRLAHHATDMRKHVASFVFYCSFVPVKNSVASVFNALRALLANAAGADICIEARLVRSLFSMTSAFFVRLQRT